MKHIFILLFCLLSTSVFSAYQYNTKGNQTWLTFDSTTNLYLEASRSGKTNDHENFIDEGKGISDWGWYNLNTNEVGSFKNNGEFTFTENDKIAIWVKDNEGNIYNSTKEPSEFIWGKSDVKNDIFKIYGGNKGSNGTHEYYVFQINTINNNSPTSQPLPGIIATLLIGGTGIFYLKNRKSLLEK
jgi:hypothetical protein